MSFIGVFFLLQTKDDVYINKGAMKDRIIIDNNKVIKKFGKKNLTLEKKRT